MHGLVFGFYEEALPGVDRLYRDLRVLAAAVKRIRKRAKFYPFGRAQVVHHLQGPDKPQRLQVAMHHTAGSAPCFVHKPVGQPRMWGSLD